jgi:DNA-binding transcriptional LysR family regulator
MTALDALLAEESVTLAAKRLHLSTPAMSHTLARIRDALGDPILVRAGRRLVPTPRALALREPVRRWLAEASAWLGPGETLGQIAREFTLRAPDEVPIVYGAALANALAQMMPRSSLRFLADSDDGGAALRDGRVDLEIGPVAERGPETLRLRLFSQRFVGAVRQGHRLRRGAMSRERYVAEQHVAYSGLTRGLPERFVALSVPSAYGALVAASRSNLVATVPARIAQAVRRTLRLTVFELPLQPLTVHVVQAWHPRFSADPAHQWLRDCVARVLKA